MGELITGYDADYSAVAALTVPAMRQYADRLGLKFSVAQFAATGRAAAWSKLPAIQAALDRGSDPVVWIDADALIVRSDDIRATMEPTKDFYVNVHSSIGGGPVINTGVIVVRNTVWSHRLLDKIWNAMLEPEHPWWEQAAFMQIAGFRSQLGRGQADEPQPEILERVGWLDRRWNAVMLRRQTVVRRTVIRHYAGIPNPSRVILLKRDLSLPPSIGDWVMPTLARAELRFSAFTQRMETKAQSSRGRIATAYYRSRGAVAQSVRGIL